VRRGCESVLGRRTEHVEAIFLDARGRVSDGLRMQWRRGLRCEVFGGINASLEAIHIVSNYSHLGQGQEVQDCVDGIFKLVALAMPLSCRCLIWLTNSATSFEDPTLISGGHIN